MMERTISCSLCQHASRWMMRSCHTASPTQMSNERNLSAWRLLRIMRKRERSLWKQWSNKPGLAATPSIQRCGSAGGRQGAAEIPAVNKAKNVKEWDSSVRWGIKLIQLKHIQKSHTHSLTQIGIIQSLSRFKTLRLVDSLAKVVDKLCNGRL